MVVYSNYSQCPVFMFSLANVSDQLVYFPVRRFSCSTLITKHECCVAVGTQSCITMYSTQNIILREAGYIFPARGT